MKILIIGPVASGKSTLAKKLNNLTSIPLFEIDNIVHDDVNKEKRSEDEQRKIINGIIRNNKEWIIEGIPRTHLEVLSSNATTIIYLDYPKNELKRRLQWRYIKIKLRLLKVNYDMNKELYDRLLNYIRNDNKEVLKEIMNKYPSKLIIIKNNKEINKYIMALKEGEILKYQ